MAEMTLPSRIRAFNATARDYDLSRSLAALLADALHVNAQRPALQFEGQSLSYAELAQRAWALANHLREAGLGAGDRVALCMPRSPELVIALLATLLSGAAYVPLDPDYPAARLAQMSEDAQASLLLGTADLSSDWLRDGTTLPILCVDATALAGQMAPPFACPAGPDDAAYMIFTSGSTGRPKGALNSHRGIVNRLCWMQEHYRLQPGERVLQKTPCSFDVSVWEFFWPLLQGACIVLARPGGHRDPRYLAGLIQQAKIDVLHFVPSMLAHFLDEPQAAHCANLRQVICSGEALPAELVRRFFQTLPGVALDNLYGPTEAAVDVSHWTCRADAQDSSVPIGFPIANTQLYVLDEQGRALDVGAVGELYIGGVQVGMGYLGRDDETRARFVDDPFQPGGRLYRTGDLARWREDGALDYLGRGDQQIKLKGNRIELGEIEALLLTLPQVRHAAVLVQNAGQADAHLLAVLSPPSALGLAALRASLASHLPEVMLPEALQFCEDMPLLPNGKLDRQTLASCMASSQSAAATTLDRDLLGFWRTALGQPELSIDSHLFEAGATSLMVLRFLAQLRHAGETRLAVADVYDQPSVRRLQAVLTQVESSQPTASARRPTQGDRHAIAIVGMAAMTPGADDLQAFWQLLLDGRDAISHFAIDELDPRVPRELAERETYVRARGVLARADEFDPAFFGIPAHEARLIDPQQRVLLQQAWLALEHAGIDPSRSGDIGVFAGVGHNTWWPLLLADAPERVQGAGEFATMVANDKDYVATRIAHRLDLHGPAISLHTACSTSLVAVAQAVAALRAGQCEIALAGGASIHVPQASGYLQVDGGMESADGVCRPFDAEANGTLFSNGAAMLVLKPLAQAERDGDTVYAVIEGIGLNNDGGEKASFTAPSLRGQLDCLQRALRDADVEGVEIGYIEAHGTGTALGDPIEVAALARAYGGAGRTQACVLGSLKSNIGHTVAAAGALGLIKAALCLHHQRIPGTAHYRAPNPQLDLAATPFEVHATSREWPSTDRPRRAAVSSFGVGGTNAHVVLREAPSRPAITRSGNDALQLWPLSARSESALQARAQDLAEALSTRPLALQDVAATLIRGRKAMSRRHSLVVGSREDAIAQLHNVTPITASRAPRAVWLFPGQGAQHPGMSAALYAAFPAFAEALDEALQAVHAYRAPTTEAQAALRELLLSDRASSGLMADTRHAQPALFCHAWAMAYWLRSLGLQPDAVIGHSIGEFAAAAVAGYLSLQDAARLVCARAEAMAAQPRGAMLAVRRDAAALATRLPPGVEIAGINAPQLTVLAGPAAIIDVFADDLAEAGVQATRLQVSHAFHSDAMSGAMPALRAACSGLPQREGSASLWSCRSGVRWQQAEASDADYWAAQMREAVRFSPAVQGVLADAERHGEDCVFIDLGPAQQLAALIRQHRDAQGQMPRVVSLCASPQTPADGARVALQGVGQLWCHGLDLGWPMPHGQTRACLPGYAFERQRIELPPPRPRGHAGDAPITTQPDGAELILSTPRREENDVSQRRERLPLLQVELRRVLAAVAGLNADELDPNAPLLAQGLDSLSLTQATLEIDRVFGEKLRFRRLLEDLDSVSKLAAHLDGVLPPERFAPRSTAPSASTVGARELAAAGAHGASQANDVLGLLQQQMAQMQQQLAALAAGGMAPVTTALPLAVASPEPKADLVAQPFGASPRIAVKPTQHLSDSQRAWLDAFTARYLARSGGSREFSQRHRARMADPRVVTGFNPLWKDLVYPLVVDRSQGSRLWDIDGNEYIDLLSCFGANLLGYQPPSVIAAMQEQLTRGIEVGPQHPLSAEVAELIAEFSGHERVGFCNTGSEAVMGAMRVARTVTGRKTIAIFTHSYHGIFDEVLVRGSKQLRSLAAAPGILANAVENILVLDYASDEALRVLRERGSELAAIMIEPVQNRFPTLQPQAFVQSLREIADQHGCALIFDEVVTGFRLAPGGAQQFYGVRADLCTYGKIIGGGLPFAAIAGKREWMDALDGGFWQYGDDSYPEAGVTYFAGTFVRHPLALAAAKATLLHLKAGGQALYDRINARTEAFIARLNRALEERAAPLRAVHCASLWRLAWDEGQTYQSLFYYLLRHHGLHVYEQFGHFVTEAMDEADLQRIGEVMLAAVDELLAQGLLQRRDGLPPPSPGTDEPAHGGPLTPGQSERWLAASFDANAMQALNETLRLQLRGDIDMAALQRALQQVCERHDAFATAFDTDGPLQGLGASRTVPVLHDLRADADPQRAADALLEAQRQARFVLDQAPLLNIDLLWLEDQHVIVHLVANHLVFDGWASSVWLRELATCYHAFARGHAPVLPPAGSPRAFAAQVQAEFDGDAGSDDLAWWQAQMQDLPAALSLGDLDPPAQRRFSAHTVQRRLQGEVWQALQARASAHKATIFQWLLCEVALWLKRETGQSDFLLSLPWAAQNFGRHPALIADGVLDLPLRLRLADSEQVDQVLPRVRDALFDALEHPRITQGRLARALHAASRGDRPPLTGVYFNLNPRLDLAAFAPLQAELSEGRKPGLLGELIFNFYEDAQALSLDLHYSDEFFSAARIESLLDALWSVLDPRVEPIDQALQDSGLAEVIRAANATGRPLAAHPQVGEVIDAQAQRNAHAIAVRSADEVWTYAELIAQSRRIAARLQAAGIGPGAWVGLCLSRQPVMIAAMLGIWRCGAAYVPLDPALPSARLQQMADDAGLDLLLSERAHAALWSAAPCARLWLDEATDAQGETDFQPVVVQADLPAYVIYTSGSTGTPKGVVVSQRNVCNFLRSMARTPGMDAEDRLLAVTTLSFDIAVLELLLPLTVGAEVVLAQRYDAIDGEALKRLIEQRAINVMQATPSTWHLLLDAGFRAPSGFRALCGGEALTPTLAARLLDAGVQLWNLYGPTETTVWSTCCQIVDATRPITVGRPIDNTWVHVLDADGKPCDVGVSGELCIGGDGVAMGYHARPELTAERFIADPLVQGGRLYRTGDLAQWTASGELLHLGRLDHQIKLRGYRIELGEIEAALEQLPTVARAVVLPIQRSETDVRLLACVVASTPAAPALAALREALAQRLPDYMLPQQVEVLDALPLLPSGKVDRRRLQEQVLAPSVAAVAVQPERPEPVQRAVAQPSAQDIEWLGQQMGELLQGKPLAADADFFAHGGHSLLAAQLAARIRREWQVKLGLRDLFEAPTPRQLATRLRAQPVSVDSPQPLSASSLSSGPLSAQQQRLWFAERLSPGQTVAHLPVAFELRGVLDQVALRQALVAVQQQQPSLRTAVRDSADGLGQQIVDAQVELPFEIVEFGKAASPAALQAALDAMLDTPFDLQQAPLWRVRLFVLDAQRAVLAAVFHHLIWDGASMALWWRALATAYAALKQHGSAALPALSHSGIDYALWQRAEQNSASAPQTLQFWRAHLEPLPAPLALPSDLPRPARWQSEAEVVRFGVPTALRQAMQIRAQQLGLAPVVLWLQAWATTLAQRAAQSELVIGVLTHGREAPEWSTLTGFLARALPLCLRGLDAASTAQRTREIATRLHAALGHVDIGVEQLVKALDLPRDPSRALLFQNTFSFEQDNSPEPSWPGLRAREWPMPLRGAEHDVGLWLQGGRERMEGVLVGAAALLDETALRGLACDVLDAAARLCGLAALGARWPSISVQPPPPGRMAKSLAAEPQVTSPASADTDATRRLLAICAELLQTTGIDPALSFVAQGGHSLLMMQLAARIESEFGTRLPLRTIVDAPDLHTLVRAVEAEQVALPPIPRLSLRAGVALSPMQTRLWHAEQLEPGKPTYHIVPCTRIEGPLDTAVLQTAIAALPGRHDALRTQFFVDAQGRPLQRLTESMDLPFEQFDLSHLADEATRVAAIQQTLAERAMQPFDIERGPLLRGFLFRLDAQTHMLGFVVHHLVSDGWSLHLLFLDIARLYLALAAGQAPTPYPASVRHADYAAWLRERAEGEALQADIDFWTGQLTPPPEPLALPGDFPAPAQPTREAGNVLIEVPDALRAQLRHTARGLDTTLFVLTLSAYAMLLHHVSGQDDLVIAVPVRGRHRADVEDVFGYFANVLPLRIQIQPEATPLSLIRQVQAQVKAAMSHAEAPLERVAEVLAQRGQRGVLYHTLFGFQDDHQRLEQMGNLRLRDWLSPPVGIAETLTVWMWDNQEGQKAYLTYRKDLFEAASMQRLAERFLQLLQGFADLRAPALAALPRATPRDLADQARWNQTDRPYPSTDNLADVLCTALAQQPERIAIRFDAETLSAAELLARSERIALALQARGIGRGQRVGLGLERGIDLVPVQLGVLRSGAAYVPLDPAFPEARLRLMAEDAALSAVLVDAPDRLPTALCDAPILLHHELLAETPTATLDPQRAAGVADAAYVIYTSGSTGKPKGVVVPHGPVVNFLHSMAREPGLSRDDRLLAVTTLSFDIAVLELLLPLLVGAELIIASREDAADGFRLRALLEQQRATLMQATPASWRMLIAAGWRGRPGFRSLVGGEALAPDLAEQLLARCAAVFNMYGPTETTVWSTLWPVEAGQPIRIGRPIDNTTVYVLAPDGTPCGVGVPGELWIGGEGVTTGYWQRPDLTAERFTPDPFSSLPEARMYRTGDRGRWRNDGLLEHLGRLDFQVKVRGFRIELGDIESCLLEHPGVAACVVMAREDVAGDVRLVAYVARRDDFADEAALRSHLRAGLPPYMLPQHLLLLDALPLLPNGKINRHALPVPQAEARAAVPLDGLEPRLALLLGLVREVLGQTDVGPDDNFFEVGGHSLLAVSLLGKLEAATGSRLNLLRLANQSLRSLAQELPETTASVEAPNDAAKPTGWRARLSRWFGGEPT